MKKYKHVIVTTALEEEMFCKEREKESAIVTGPGKTWATMNSVIHIAQFGDLTADLYPKDTLVVNLGTAGGNFELGTIVNPKIFLDDSDAATMFPEFFPAIGLYEDSEKEVTCVTSDSFSSSFRKNAVADMEAYSIAQLCSHFGFDFLCYKVVTDAGSKTEWEKNLKPMMQKLWDYYYKEVYPMVV